MATLVDHQIKALALKGESPLIAPFAWDQLNPASYDVLLGGTILVEPEVPSSSRVWRQVDISRAPYRLKPGQFILASTVEYIHLPDDVEATFCLKSSRGRDGFDHALAGFCDPGFRGQVTLELKNANQYHKLMIQAGMRIGQLRFARLEDIPARGYDQTGRYNGQIGPTAALV
jgi:dCTP deaminase